MIRPADPERDGAACAAIYGPYIAASAITFEEEVLDAAQMTQRMRDIWLTHPWLVAELDGAVVGFAYAAPHRIRHAYRWAADVSIYVDPRVQRSGLGRALYTALFERLRAQGIFWACAGITLPNDPSVGLHEALGFTPIGIYRAIGFKLGEWRDVGWWQLQLAPLPNCAPPEPARPRRLEDA